MGTRCVGNLCRRGSCVASSACREVGLVVCTPCTSTFNCISSIHLSCTCWGPCSYRMHWRYIGGQVRTEPDRAVEAATEQAGWAPQPRGNPAPNVRMPDRDCRGNIVPHLPPIVSPSTQLLCRRWAPTRLLRALSNLFEAADLCREFPLVAAARTGTTRPACSNQLHTTVRQ